MDSVASSTSLISMSLSWTPHWLSEVSQLASSHCCSLKLYYWYCTVFIFRLKMQCTTDSYAQQFHVYYHYAITFVNQIYSLIKAQKSDLFDKFAYSYCKAMSLALIVFFPLILSWLNPIQAFLYFPWKWAKPNQPAVTGLVLWRKITTSLLLCSVPLLCPDPTFLWLSLPWPPSQNSTSSFAPGEA